VVQLATGIEGVLEPALLVRVILDAFQVKWRFQNATAAITAQKAASEPEDETMWTEKGSTIIHVDLAKRSMGEVWVHERAFGT
jgi:hypothetical protein